MVSLETLTRETINLYSERFPERNILLRRTIIHIINQFLEDRSIRKRGNVKEL